MTLLEVEVLGDQTPEDCSGAVGRRSLSAIYYPCKDHYDIIAKGPALGIEETFWRSRYCTASVVVLDATFNRVTVRGCVPAGTFGTTASI